LTWISCLFRPQGNDWLSESSGLPLPARWPAKRRDFQVWTKIPG